MQELLPDPDIINFFPESIDFGKYINIQYLISWDMEPSDNAKKYFIKVFTNSNLSIWRRNRALSHEKADHGPGSVGSHDYRQTGLPALKADFLRQDQWWPQEAGIGKDYW